MRRGSRRRHVTDAKINMTDDIGDSGMSEPQTITVTELNNRVKNILGKSDAINGVWLVGELSNVKCYSSGHYYFTIKDGGSQLRGVLFRGARSRIDFEPKDSLKVMAYGRVDLYVPYGSYQFIVETMRRSGIGELYAEYERLKKKLAAEGLFNKTRKRPLPTYPKTIGVVTSESGAVIHDIITTTRRMFPVDILLAPAKVQGEGSAQSVVAGIELLNRVGVDVIIVGRGGGSIEDLWSFNEESVARAIVASKAPVISSVGHETDFTIADFVADVRAATPTAAAELAVRDGNEIRRELSGFDVRMGKALTRAAERMRSRFEAVDAKLSPYRAENMVGMHNMALDTLSQRMASALRSKVADMHRRLMTADMSMSPALKENLSSAKRRAERLSVRADPAMASVINGKRARAEKAFAALSGLDPTAVLGRGYSYVASSDGRAVTSARDLEVGSVVTVRMRDGRAEAEIMNKEEYR